MLYFIFIISLFLQNVYSIPCQGSIDATIKEMNESLENKLTIDNSLSNVLFAKGKTSVLIENGKILLDHGQNISVNMFQDKGANYTVDISYVDLNIHSMFFSLKNNRTKALFSFDLRALVKAGNLKEVKKLEYLGTGGSGSVFKVEYKNGTRETLKLYHSYSADARKAKVDFTEQRLLYLMFGQDKTSKVGVSNYTMLRKRDVLVTIIDPNGTSKFMHGKVIKVETLAKGNILNNIKRQMSDLQKDIIVRKFKNFIFNPNNDYFIKKTDETFEATDEFKKKFFAIPGIKDYLSYNKMYNNINLIDKIELIVDFYPRLNGDIYKLPNKRMFSVSLKMYGYDKKEHIIHSLVELFNIFLTEDGSLRVIDPN